MLPYLPDEIVSLIYDFNRPKIGFEIKKGQIFNCGEFDVEISEVQIRRFYDVIAIQGYRCFPNEKVGFCTTIPIISKYKDMCIDKNNWISFQLNKNNLKLQKRE